MPLNDVIIRPISGVDELDLFRRLPYVLNHELDDDFAQGRRRPEWAWVALSGDRLLARLAWWAPPSAATPVLLDFLDVEQALSSAERLEVGSRLLRAALLAALPDAPRPPDFTRFVPPDWRDDAAARSVVEGRMAILEQVGATLSVERLRFEWRPGTPLPSPTGRLEFRSVQDTDELLDLMTSALGGTLDARSRDDLARMTPREAAIRHYQEELAGFKSPRDWWRVATLPGGEPVGFVIPARNTYNAIIAYLAVLPKHRGHGYIDDILTEGTRILAAQEVPRIRASTDLGNVPMAESFRRGGYVNFEREIKMAWTD